MNVAELFVSLGVKGSDKTVGALTGMKKDLTGVKDVALETKVALIGAMYALERLFATSGQKGTDLTNLNALLGTSTTTLQQYEYAARQAGISNEEIDGTFKGLQETMSKAWMGKGVPAGMAQFSKTLAQNFTDADLKSWADNPEKLIQKLEEYAKKEKNIGLRNQTMKSFGISDNVISGMARNTFKQENLDKAPTYSKKEVGSLDKANIAWSNLGTTIQMAVGHFNAAHGGQLVEDISKLVPKVLELAAAFIKMAESLHFFDGFSKAIEGWSQIFGAITGSVKDINADKEGVGHGIKEKVKGFVTGDIPDAFKYIFSDEKKGGLGGADKIKTGAGDLLNSVKNYGKPESNSPPSADNNKAVSPTPGTVSPAQKSQNVNINQNLNFQHDGKDAKKTGDSTKKAIKDAFRQLPAQAQGS